MEYKKKDSMIKMYRFYNKFADKILGFFVGYIRKYLHTIECNLHYMTIAYENYV